MSRQSTSARSEPPLRFRVRRCGDAAVRFRVRVRVRVPVRVPERVRMRVGAAVRSRSLDANAEREPEPEPRTERRTPEPPHPEPRRGRAGPLPHRPCGNGRHNSVRTELTRAAGVTRARSGRTVNPSAQPDRAALLSEAFVQVDVVQQDILEAPLHVWRVERLAAHRVVRVERADDRVGQLGLKIG